MLVDVIIGVVAGFAASMLYTSIQKRKEYCDRSIIKLKSKYIGGMSFKFVANSMSKNSIWIKKICLASETSESEISFNPPIFADGDIRLLKHDMPSDFAGMVRIAEVEAMMQIDNMWKTCVVVIRGVKDNEIDLEFFPEA